jgi:hypothetical protein
VILLTNPTKDAILFTRLANEFIHREGFDTLLSNITKTDFFTAPASTRFHDSEEGGLCHHSIKVFHILKADVGNLYSDETLAIVSLLHDICKIGYYVVSSRNVKDEHGKWKSVPYYTIDDQLPYGHGEKSVIMIMQDMKLTMEESMAIRWHMGAYEGDKVWNTLSVAYNKFPLALHLHIADMKATYLK